MSHKVSVIIPCFWSSQKLIDMTLECIQSLAKYTDQPVETKVVDDGSPLRPPFTSYLGNNNSFVCLRENRGFAGAVNAGLKAATGDILVISNNDIIFTPGWLTELLRPLDEGYDISSIRTSDADGWATEDKITEGDKFGSLWAMKRKVYEKLGGLGEDFGRGTFEDLDYRRRAINAGFKIAKNHNGLVEHIGRATFDEVDPGHSEYLKNRETYLNKWGRIGDDMAGER